MPNTVEKLIAEAWEAGGSLNLDDCLYGVPHWVGETPVRPFPYYFFLAGLARTRQCRRILEIGTHMGGSTLALRKGSAEALDSLVTIDPTDLSDSALSSHPEICKLQGDAIDPLVIRRVIDVFGAQPIDLLYIDALHDYEHTILYYGIFNSLLRPRVILLDDIFLNRSMRQMWFDIRRSVPRETLDTTAVDDGIRQVDAGFGVRLVGADAQPPMTSAIVTESTEIVFATASRPVDPVVLSNPTEQMVKMRFSWRDARGRYMPVLRIGRGEALRPEDRRLCVFVDTETKSLYVGVFVEEIRQELTCTTAHGSIPNGRMCEVSVRASTALGCIEVSLEGVVTACWYDSNGRMPTAEPRVLLGAETGSIMLEEGHLSQAIF